MEFQFPPINYLYLVSCVMAVSLVIFSARQTHNFGARLWVAVMVGFALWTGGELAAIAALVRSSIRPTDQLARWGGEEFCLVLNDTSPDAGMAVIERLRHRIEQYRVEHEGVQLGITMTFGVVARQPGESMDDCIARADAAMYEGKRSGRNTVVAAF